MNTSTIFRHFRQTFDTLVLIMIIASGAIYANTLTKPYEIGEGTAYGRSNFRTFAVPCGQSVAASVSFKRKGEAAAANDVPIIIELRKPGATADEDGEIAQTKNATVKTTEQTVSLNGGESRLGCALPWRVRVRHAGDGNAPFAIYGTISLTFNDNSRQVAVQDAGSINLNSANTVTVNVGSSQGLEQGLITIRGVWFHNLGVVPVKMRFELLDPSGTVVAADTGYSNEEINPCCSNNKMKISFNVTSCRTGQWKLRIKNISEGHDAIRVKPSASLKPDCPN